jgi:hypothetical protein
VKYYTLLGYKDMRMNKTKPFLIEFHLLKYFLILSFLMGQKEKQMSASWIDVKGRSPKGVKDIIKEGTRIIYIYSSKVIDKVVKY